MAVIIERMAGARGTAAQWTSSNPVLLAGEIGWESDTNTFKFGDGVTAWSSLPYFTLSGKANLASPAFTGTPTAPTASPGTNSTQIATTAYADAIAALKANIASPTFTGTPAAPTAAVGTNTTQLATTAYVTAGFGPTIASGTATLVAGTVNVTGLASATANTVVRLNYKTVGGTPGATFINARTAGTGFTIKSTSATDTSVVQYEVISW